MTGCEWIYENGKDDLEKACALLAGWAIICLRKSEDYRKCEAFAGKLSVPFLVNASPPADTKRLMLLPRTNEWLVFSVSRSGKPKVLLRDSGLAGLEQCVLLVTRKS